MTSVRERSRPARRGQASKAPTGPLSSNKSNNGDHKDPLGSNKLGPSEAPTRPEILVGPETPTGPPQFPPLPVSQDLGAH